ncbi:DNA starvation/stationary phase protection protein Dps [Rhodospirillaceae bacterium SYSU D60014]|uniref:DNA starvation/stationary phase protection protein Dps n=1 Tax=Virgifigura deserti TaxID=2268457 RepID=UPI000E66E0CC
MHKTKIDIAANTRKAAIELLQARLADAVDLATQAKQAHWNVKGPSFIALHELFDTVAEDSRGHADLIAERIAALGGVAEGTAAVAAERSTLSRYPLDIADGAAHVDALSAALAGFGKGVRAAIDSAAEMGDQTTADVFTEVSRGVDKDLWMVEAHAQAKT